MTFKLSQFNLIIWKVNSIHLKRGWWEEREVTNLGETDAERASRLEDGEKAKCPVQRCRMVCPMVPVMMIEPWPNGPYGLRCSPTFGLITYSLLEGCRRLGEVYLGWKDLSVSSQLIEAKPFKLKRINYLYLLHEILYTHAKISKLTNQRACSKYWK